MKRVIYLTRKLKLNITIIKSINAVHKPTHKRNSINSTLFLLEKKLKHLNKVYKKYLIETKSNSHHTGNEKHI